MKWENTSINERVKYILDELFDGNTTAMAKSSFIRRTSINNIVANDTAPGFEIIYNLLKMKNGAINPEWLILGTGPVYKKEIPFPGKMLPDLPPDYSAAAGFTDDLAVGILASACPQQPVYHATPDYDLTITTRGDSMEPMFLTGDKLCLKRCTGFVMWGAPHVLDTSEGIYLKRIYDEGENIRCVSENSDYNDFTIPKSSIRGIYKVVALHRIC